MANNKQHNCNNRNDNNNHKITKINNHKNAKTWIHFIKEKWDKSGGVFLMERTMSVEEKIKRAEEIYNRSKGITTQETKTE